jgi:LPPG:FO 2-phospho-L-lactate transferase
MSAAESKLVEGTRFVALSGGVGGAKLSLGLAHLLGERLSVMVNTGDDFEHVGLHVSPDVDTALYTLAGVVNPETGWGRRDETWTFMRALAELGGPAWFKLGDGDLAMHVERTRRLREGASLTSFCADAASRLGIAARILPMADAPVRTVLETDAGTLSFQEYFVRDQCRPAVGKIRFEGAAASRPTVEVLGALSAPDLAGVIICPSNPWLSIDPILAVPGMREALLSAKAPIIAVSPIVAGKAIKGPAAKIMRELGLDVDTRAIAEHYRGLIAGMVIDREDAGLEAGLSTEALVTNTVMHTVEDKIELARACLGFCGRLAAKRTETRGGERPLETMR